jgi:hypothetical protein
MKRSRIKRTAFRIRVKEDKTPLPFRARNKARLRRGGSLSANGKKARLRESINAPNRIRFAAMGLLNACEARLPGCWPNGDLTWAHGKKDRELSMEERKYLVIRACTVCHHKLDEQMSHAEMLEFVQGVIERRVIAA